MEIYLNAMWKTRDHEGSGPERELAKKKGGFLSFRLGNEHCSTTTWPPAHPKPWLRPCQHCLFPNKTSLRKISMPGLPGW